MKKIIYSKYNSHRAPEFRIRTSIVEENGRKYVTKTPLGKASIPHLKAMVENQKALSQVYRYIQPVECWEYGQGVAFEYLRGQALDKNVDYARDDLNVIKEKLDKILDMILDFDPAHVKNGQVCPANVDSIISNFVRVDGKVYLLDYEWVENEPVSISYLRYRAILYAFREHVDELKHRITVEEFIELFGMSKREISVYYRMESAFQNHIHGRRSKYMYADQYEKRITDFEEFRQAFENNINTLSEAIAARDAHINYLNHQINDKVSEINNLNAALSRKTETLGNIKHSIKNPIFGLKYAGKVITGRLRRPVRVDSVWLANFEKELSGDYDFWIKNKKSNVEELHDTLGEDGPKLSVIISKMGGMDAESTRKSIEEQNQKAFEIIETSDSLDDISGSFNECIGRASGEYLVFIEAGDTLEKGALLDITRSIIKEKNPTILYSDEDKQRDEGSLYEPYFKPDYSPDTLLCRPYMSKLFVVKRETVQAIGGAKPEYANALMYDFTLRLSAFVYKNEGRKGIYHIQRVLYHSIEREKKNFSIYDEDAIQVHRIKENYLTANGYPGKIEPAEGTPYSRVVYEVKGRPLVSIVIPSKDHPEVLLTCISSLAGRTMYRDYEIIVVDNGSNPENKARYEYICANHDARYIYAPMEFNFSAMCNLGAQKARGEYLVFLNDDIEITQSHWLSTMLGAACLPHAGAVGAKLCYPNGNLLQHVGIVNVVPGPCHILPQADDNGVYPYYQNRLDFDVIAVTAACLMVSKAKFDEVEGFCEDLAVAYNDVDLCFKLYEAGYYNIQRNDVRLTHYESLSRGLDMEDRRKTKRLFDERQKLYDRHKSLLARDPFYNKNLDTFTASYNINMDADYDFYVRKVDEYPDGKAEGTRINIDRIALDWGLHVIGWALFDRGNNTAPISVMLKRAEDGVCFELNARRMINASLEGIFGFIPYSKFGGFRTMTDVRKIQEGAYHIYVVFEGKKYDTGKDVTLGVEEEKPFADEPKDDENYDVNAGGEEAIEGKTEPAAKTPTESLSLRKRLGKYKRKILTDIANKKVASLSGIEREKALDILGDYDHWIRSIEKIEQEDEDPIALSYEPLISVLVPVYNCDTRYLDECIGSVRNQSYKNWELVLVDDCSTFPNVRPDMERAARSDDRIKIFFVEKNGGISKTTNIALEKARGEYVALLDCDDIISPNALYENVKLLNENKELDLIYSDEDKVTDDGKIRLNPYFKPDFSPDTLLSFNYICHFCVIRKSLVEKVGGFNSKYDGAQDHDLMLRVTENTKSIAHISKILYHWRMRAGSTADKPEAKSYAMIAAEELKMEAIKRRGYTGKITSIADVSRVTLDIEGEPKVSVVIPSKDHPQVLELCLSSMDKLTEYKNYEVIVVDNGSKEENRKEYEKLCEKYGAQYLYEQYEFNFSKMCNKGAAKAMGDYLLFLNDDIEIIRSDWLSVMLGAAQQEHAGAVGAKLLFPGGKLIQHIGVINTVAGPSHMFYRHDDSAVYYYHQNRLDFNVLAVTAACLLLKKKIFEEIGGFDESFAVAYNDVELCFRIHKAGYLNIIRNDAVLIHHESLSRGYDIGNEKKTERLFNEWERLYSIYPEYKGRDPYYSRHLHQYLANFDNFYDEGFDFYCKETTENIPEGSPSDIRFFIDATVADWAVQISGWAVFVGEDNIEPLELLLVDESRSLLLATKKVYRMDVGVAHFTQRNAMFAGFRTVTDRHVVPNGNYRIYIVKNGKKYDTGKYVKKGIVRKGEDLEYKPKFSFVVPLYNTPASYLVELLDSLTGQSYDHLEVCLADGSNPEHSEEIAGLVGKYKSSGYEIKYTQIENKGIAENTNEAIRLATGDYIVFVDHDDTIDSDSLYEFVKAINEDRDREVLYSDQDFVDAQGKIYTSPLYKPDYNLDFLRSGNYISHLYCVSAELVEKVGMLDGNYDGAQDYDFTLRTCEAAKSVYHVKKILYHWRTIESSTAANPESKTYAYENGRRALEAHLHRCGYENARVENTDILGKYRIEYGLSDENESVLSIDLSEKPVDVLLADFVNQKANEGADKGYIFIIDKGIESADGNMDSLVNLMKDVAGREDVGCVGASIVTKDDKREHCGLMMIGGRVFAPFFGESAKHVGFMESTRAYMDFDALSTACIMIKADVFKKLDGFDVSKGDWAGIDFCLRSGAAGYLNVYHPFAKAIRNEGGVLPVSELKSGVVMDGDYPTGKGLAPILFGG